LLVVAGSNLRSWLSLFSPTTPLIWVFPRVFLAIVDVVVLLDGSSHSGFVRDIAYMPLMACCSEFIGWLDWNRWDDSSVVMSLFVCISAWVDPIAPGWLSLVAVLTLLLR
jgi:hypothetical protein